MTDKLNAVAKDMRLNILNMSARAGAEGKSVHIAPALSMVEILAVLFTEAMRPQDVFILSKGHGGMAYYAALNSSGYITDEQLDTFDCDGTDFCGHPSKNIKNRIVFSSGSLGMGLSYACGLAISAKKHDEDKNIYVLLGNGELNEGSNWESIMFAKQQKLDNIIAIVDNNGMQSDGNSAEVLDVNWKNAFDSFGWQTRVCDGHSTEELACAFEFSAGDSPLVILANTIKGKGVSFMENDNSWHHNRLSDNQHQDAIKEVNAGGL
jgi:transketolase